MLKKLICALLTVAMLLALISCGDYEPVPSTADEARTVMTFRIEGEKYELKYELYRCLFLTYKSLVDGGDESVWSGDERSEYIAEIDEMIISAAADIFAVFHVAKSIGQDPFSNAYEEQIKELIKTSVDGGADEDGTIEGFGGDYEAYLDSLTDYYMNYSVSTMILRYSLAYQAIIDHYKGNTYEENLDEVIKIGELQFNESNVLEFYNGEESVRVLMATLDSRSFSSERAQQIRDKMGSFTNEEGVKNYILSFTATTAEDAARGMIVGEYSLDGAYYSALTEAAFDLGLYQTSSVIPIATGSFSSYYILYKTDKSEEFYNENRADVYSAFIDNEIGKLIAAAKDRLIESGEASPLLSELVRDQISMEEA